MDALSITALVVADRKIPCKVRSGRGFSTVFDVTSKKKSASRYRPDNPTSTGGAYDPMTQQEKFDWISDRLPQVFDRDGFGEVWNVDGEPVKWDTIQDGDPWHPIEWVRVPPKKFLTAEEKKWYASQREKNAVREAKECPKILLIMKPVDGGSAMIGMIECPHCGQEHLTTDIRCGERKVFCGSAAESPDGYNRVSVERII